MKPKIDKFPGYKLFEGLEGYIPFKNPRPALYAYLALINLFILLVSGHVLSQNNWWALEDRLFAFLIFLSYGFLVGYDVVFVRGLRNWKKYEDLKKGLEKVTEGFEEETQSDEEKTKNNS